MENIKEYENVFYFSTLETVDNFIKGYAQYEKGHTFKNTNKIVSISEGLLKEYMDKLQLYYMNKYTVVPEKKLISK